MKKIVMGLSGGMDSATLLGDLLQQGGLVHCCMFNYGSKHNKYENEAARNLFAFFRDKGFPVTLRYFDLSVVMGEFSSDLLLSGGNIPQGHYNDETMKKTVVPGRNLILSSIMAGLAESLEADCIVLGVHSGDHHIYPDCRKEFVKALDNMVYLSSDRKVEVLTPYENHDKEAILRIGCYGLDIPIPYHLTRTCYKDQEKSCGKCGSCTERLEAFKLIGKKDPIEYDDPP